MDNRIFFMINKVQRRMLNHADQQCEKSLDTSITQMAALFYIDKHPGCLQKDLGQALGLKKAAITGLLSRMESNGLITRLVCETDSRAMRLQTTTTGLEKMTAAKPMLKDMNQQICEGFTDAEMAVVIRFLNAMLERF
ncbi:MAG: MarR family winged helix-turn-helix transcriptional regulator [Amphritea sp.]|nr:MarR family winged helix-turn-helix transcriptional regulator [Amphritea sp.]